MKIRNSLKTAFVLFLTAVMVLSIVPAPAFAASSADIQRELDSLKDENKAIQAEINAIRRDFDANASDIQALVDQKNAVDQEIALLNTQIININDQIAAYGQLIADAQDQLDLAQDHLNDLSRKHNMKDSRQIIYHLDSTNLSNYTNDEIEYMLIAY